jgi:hypothetical protein
MAFPVTPIIDTFTGTDGTSPPSNNWINNYNGLRILSNRCAGTANDWNTATRNNGLVLVPGAIEMYADVPVLPDVDGYGINFYFTDISGNGYALEYQWVSAGNDTFKFFKMTGYAEDGQLGSTITQNLSAGDSIGFSLINGVLKAYRKPSGGSWGQIGSDVNDSTYLPDNQAALGIQGTVARVDNFGAGSPVTVALTGTAAASINESNIVAGGKTIILTLTGNKWRPS